MSRQGAICGTRVNARGKLNQLHVALNECLYNVRGAFGIMLTDGEMDMLIDSVIETAKRRDEAG